MDIKIEKLYKKYDDKVIFSEFNMTLKENTVNTIVGKSGCGKTTLLKILTGIIMKDSGEIKGLNKDEISYIFQEDRLVEWLTVKENLEFILKGKFCKSEIDEMCNKYLSLVGMEEYKDFYPQKLSGGMRQRVNIARAFLKPSKLIIMDEPFKSIDIINKYEIMKALNDILSKENRTVIFVTHDIEEAIYFNGYIYVLCENPVKIRSVLENVNNNITKEDIIKLFKKI